MKAREVLSQKGLLRTNKPDSKIFEDKKCTWFLPRISKLDARMRELENWLKFINLELNI